ncbi:MAG: TonB-dependent receptor [Planctomycetota bacterium]
MIAASAASSLLAGCATQQPIWSRPAQDPGGKQGQVRQRPVIVTARKREEQLQNVPASLSALSESRVRDAGINDVKDASYYVPNVLLTEFSSRRLSFPFFRGVGSGQGDPAVATYIDGVPQLTVSSTNLPLLSVERIEFLRGPQGVLYGRNTIGGVIHVISKPPASTPELDAAAMAGSFRRQDYRVSWSVPILEEELFLSVAGLHRERDGYTDNDLSGNDVDFRDEWFGRLQLYWVPDEQNELRFNLHGERARDGGFVLSDLGGLRRRPNHINQDFEGRAARDIITPALTWKRYGGDSDLTSITALSDWRIDETADLDFSALDGLRRFTSEEQTWVSQELRLASAENSYVQLAEETRLGWLVGISGFFSDSERAAANEFRPGGAGILFPPGNVGTDRARGSFEEWNVALFGQLTVSVGKPLELTTALRYDSESKKAKIRRQFEAGGFVVPTADTRPSETFDELLPRFSAAYRWSAAVMTYGLAARGFKAGGFNLTAPTGQESFGPETSWTYEAGVKTSFLEDRLGANVALFHIEWDDMQLSQFDSSTGGFVSNAGEAQSRGVELELTARPVSGLEVSGAFGWLDTEFERFTDQFGQDVSGRHLPFAPHTTSSFGAQYSAELSRDLELFLRSDYFHLGEFFYDAGNLGGERYELANFRLGLGGALWRLEVWIRNAFDQRYVPVAFQPSPADPRLFVGESAAPRTFGLTLRLTF